MECKDCLSLTRTIVLDVCLNTFNLVLSFINIHYFFNTQETMKIGYLTLFLMWFPGMVTSVGFLLLYIRGAKVVSILRTWKLFFYPFCLLVFYPVLPVILTIMYLVKRDAKHQDRARLSRLFAAFLDHGPQFILRVVVVVLNGLPHRGLYRRDDVIFILSMVASFMSLLLSALYFNERKSRVATRLFISTPMFAAIFGCRAFTLAVFLREVLQDESPLLQQLLCLLVLLLMFSTNIVLFRWCGQDWIRSVVFSLSSLLIPAGYNNDPEYYQLPHQNLLHDQDKCHPAPRLRRELSNETPGQMREGERGLSEMKLEKDGVEIVDEVVLEPMRSGKYLLGHILMNSVLMGVCSVYIYFSANLLDQQADEALVIPQILCVIPGLLFGIGRSFLHADFFPVYEDDNSISDRACGACRKGMKIFLSVSFTCLGYASLVPAVMWTVVYKIIAYLSD